MAFQGWKNFYKEGDQINELVPTAGEMRQFLISHPDYARNYWRNILLEDKPNYLLALTKGELAADEPVAESQLSGFLKLAFYNDQMAQKGL